MRNENFYALASQILPALLIANMIEARAVLKWVDAISTKETLEDNQTHIVAVYATATLFFALGEGLSLAVVYHGTDGKFVTWASSAVIAALVCQGLLVVAAPVVTLFLQATERFLPLRRRSADAEVQEPGE